MTPTRIAVLGGGAGALAAAYELTEHFERDEVEITVYTRGWRLGGKGASGRDATHHHRIEEHGLHIWFGFYDEAFDLMGKAYAAAGDDRPHDDPAKAFTAIDHLALWNGHDARYLIELPSDRLDLRRGAQGAPSYGVGIGRWLLAVYRARQEAVRPIAPGLARMADPPEALVALAEGEKRGLLPRWTIGAAERVVRATYEHLVDHDVEDLQLVALFDLFAAVLKLMDEGELLDQHGCWREEALMTINKLEFRAWLRPKLSQPHETLGAPFLRALYDLVFAYPAGRRPDVATSDPVGEIAAGVLLRGMLRIFAAHRGSMMLRMNGGMGDVVFAPLYFALAKRGVRFEFFRGVQALEPGDDGHVQQIRMVRQARTKPDSSGVRPQYVPLYRPGGGHWAWPNQPDWSQLDVAPNQRGHDFERELDPLDGETTVLRAGEDFDEVVLGIPPGALEDEGAALGAACISFERMRLGIETVATQALQLWLTRPTEEIGLASERTTISGAYDPPFDTFVDMTQLLGDGIEPWPAEAAVVSVAYFCGVLDEEQALDPDAVGLVLANAGRFLDAHPWKDELIGALADGRGAPDGRLDDQYVRANTHGSDRYVLSRPGSLATRLQPGDSGFSNLVLAGDWTRSSVDAGCVEAAVCSGRLAARAIAARRR